MPNDTTKSPRGKAEKPYEASPLFVHQTGRWCKKVRGVHRYFGPVSGDPKGEAALKPQRDTLLASLEPRRNPEGGTAKKPANAFLTHKQSFLEAGEQGRKGVAATAIRRQA